VTNPLERVLITGGAGFLGSRLTEAFQHHGVAVRIFDLAERPEWAHGDGIEYINGDVRDPAALSPVLEGADAVIHSAFASPRMAPETIQSVNADGAREVARQAIAHGVTRLVLVSSTVVEGAPRVHPFLKNAGITTFDWYRRSRVDAERIVTELGNPNFRVAIVRPKTFVGAGRVSAFNIVFEWIRQGKPVLLMGRAANPYQLLEITDMAEGIRLLTHSTAEGVFHFGASRFGTLRDDLQALIDHAGTSARLRSVPAPLARAILRSMEAAGMTRPSELHYMSAWGKESVADTSRARNELGWQPRWSNIEALRHAYDWYVQSIESTGAARSIHALPASHRVIDKLIGAILR
jgi:nucleoside-diphosphate-sugar epimerase